MQRRHLLAALGTVAAAPGLAAGSAWQDVLELPAKQSPLAQRSLVTGLCRAGARVVSVGQRGQVLVSDDQGKTWQQGSVPVSSDLTAVHFPTPQQGWAVGHDGVILTSGDAGKTWTRQLDGRGLGALLRTAYAGQGDARAQAEIERLAAQGAENPWLSVWFDDAQQGFVVGAFGLALRTTDGGRSWQPFMQLLDNPKGLHLYAITRVGGRLYVVGEQGLALRQGDAGVDARFEALTLPYAGTLFGVQGLAGEGDVPLLVYGLRGTLLRSADAGRSWDKLDSGINVGLTAAALDAAGRPLIVSQSGHLLRGDVAGSRFTALPVAQPLPAAAVVAAGPHAVVVGGPRGLVALDIA